MLYNYSQPNHQNQAHGQPHHHGMQPDHTGHAGTGAVIGHHSTYSSGVLSNSSPYSMNNNLPIGHSGTTRGGQAQQITEHWADQLRLHKESERAHSTMIEQHQPHFYARLKASENKGIGPATVGTAPPPTSSEDEALRRPLDLETTTQRQDWHNLDMSGQGLKCLSMPLFTYKFLHELYLSSNKLTCLPPSIGELRHLTLLDASSNQITELPPELGMCTFLRQLLLFDNHIRSLPYELGSLFNLEMLGIEGNQELDPEMKQEVMDKGTRSLISLLREQAPGKDSRSEHALLNHPH